MATKIRDIVPVSFAISTPTERSQAFNFPLVLADTVSQKERVASYSSLEAMTDAGFSTTEDAYLMASDIFSQTSKQGKTLPIVKVGRKYKDQNTTIDVTFDADATAGTFTLAIAKEEGTPEVTGTINWNETVAANIETVIESNTNVASVTVTINGTNAGDAEGITIEFDGADANTLFEVTAVDVSALTSVTTATIDHVAYGSATETWTEGVNNVVAYDSEFWALFASTKVEADILLIAAAVEPLNNKFFWGLTADAAVPTSSTTDVASDLETLAYKRTLIAYSEDTTAHATAIWGGACLPDFLGAVNPCYYPLTGLVADSLTDTEIQYLVAKKVNRFESIGGVTIVPGTAAGQEGNVGGINCAGQFIDQVFAKDYLETRVSEDVYNLLIQEERVTSLSQIEAVIRATLETEGVARGVIVEGSIDVNIDTATLNKTTRTATFPNGTAELTAAVNKIDISFDLV